MMCANAGLHPDQARWQVGKSRVDLAARPFLSKHDRTTLILPHDVERVLPNIDADHGDCVVGLLRHGVLSSSSLPRASFYHWRGWSTAGPSHSDVPSQAHNARFPVPTRIHREVLALMDRAEEKAGREDVGEQALMRGLDTAFPFFRPGLSWSSVGR